MQEASGEFGIGTYLGDASGQRIVNKPVDKGRKSNYCFFLCVAVDRILMLFFFFSLFYYSAENALLAKFQRVAFVLIQH